MVIRGGFKVAVVVLLIVVLVTSLSACFVGVAPSDKGTPTPAPTPTPTPVLPGTGHIEGVVWCYPPGLRDLLPLTTATSDNPETAKVTISGPVPGVTEVDSNGCYLFADLPAGSYQVTASAMWYLSQTQTVELQLGQELTLEPFILERGWGAIKGRIVCGGEGIDKATLRATNVTTGHVPAATYSEADGSYSMEVPAGGYMVFAGGIFNPECFDLAEAYNDTTRSFVVETEAVVTHDIILEETSLTGTWTINSWGTFRYQAWSEANGERSVSEGGDQFGRNFKIAVKREKKTLTGKGTNVLMGQSADLAGEVKDDSTVTFTIPEKFPVEGFGDVDLLQKFTGRLSDREITGTFSGGFEVGNDRQGIHFTIEGQFTASVGPESEVIPAPTPRPTVYPERGPSTIHGSVTFSASYSNWRIENYPISTAELENPENAEVTISGPAEDVQEVDEYGTFTFTDIPSGTYKVTASARWYTSETREVTVYPNSTTIASFSLTKETGTIKGRVLCRGRGIGVPNARLDVSFAPKGYTSYRVRSAEDGSYSEEVDAGRYIIFAEAADMFSWDSYNETAPSLVVEPGATVIHDVILVPLMEVYEIEPDIGLDIRQETTVDGWVINKYYHRAEATVKVVDWFGPLSGVEIYAHWSGEFSGSVSAVTNGEGCFTFTTDWVERHPTFNFTVDRLEKTGWEVKEGNLPFSFLWPTQS